LENKSRRVEQN